MPNIQKIMWYYTLEYISFFRFFLTPPLTFKEESTLNTKKSNAPIHSYITFLISYIALTL